MAAIHYLKQPFHAPSPSQRLVMIVKTHGCDFEVVLSLGKDQAPTTLASDILFETALDIAKRAVKQFVIDSIYVVGVTTAVEKSGLSPVAALQMH